MVFSLLLFLTGSAQDMLYQKSGNVIRCKIVEITPELIRYARVDIFNSPVYELKKEEVVQIKYKNKVIDRPDLEFQLVVPDSTVKHSDTGGYSMIYIVFDPDATTQIFPVYIGGRYICTLRHHSRLAYKIYSEGKIEICRISNDRSGPSRTMNIRHGCKYAIAIGIKNEQITDPGQRFYMDVIEEQNAVQGFIEKYYLGFNPYKSDDHQIAERKQEN